LDQQIIEPGLCRRIHRRLLAWFDLHRRDLPWRQTRDAYRIWVSEVMLQQTQVAAVIPFYLRFLKAFPTLKALAAANEQQVLRVWEGLGYYRRARHLHQAARLLVREQYERLPDDPDVWKSLPGVGRYTLGAVLSQAFDRRLPILEANSTRLLCRLLGVRQAPKRSRIQNLLWRYAEQLLPSRRVGDFNQALMELGALVCKPAAPGCGHCPLAAVCVAHRLGLQARLPVRPPAPAKVAVAEVAAVVRRGRRVLVVQRPDAGRWANLWEFPHDSLQRGETSAAAGRIVTALTGVTVALGPELMTLTHTITRYSITLVCFEAIHQGGEFLSTHYQRGRWIEPAQLARLPFSSPQRRLAQFICDKIMPPKSS
jgi:A/G-specific adenine glycosylase